jgi:hypothetical protein
VLPVVSPIPEGPEMRGLLFAVLLAIVAVYVASQFQTGAPWARGICGYAGPACDHPQWLLGAGAVVILVYAMSRMRD